jgi:hypothetical protein
LARRPPLRLATTTTTRPLVPSCLRLRPPLDLILRHRIRCTVTNNGNNRRRLTDQFHFFIFFPFFFLWKIPLDAFFCCKFSSFLFYFLYYLSVNDFLFNGKNGFSFLPPLQKKTKK